MNNVILLTIVFLKNSLQRIQSRYYENTKKNKKIRRNVLIFALVFLAGVIGFLSSYIIDLLGEVDQESSFIGLILFGVLIITVLQVIFSSTNILYFAKDTEYILPLPLKPYQIILARTNVILILQYAIEILIGLVPLAVYGYKMGCDTMFYIPMLISLILLPILPIIIVLLLIMILMSFSKITKNRNKFQIFITFFVLALIVAGTLFVFRIDGNAITTERIEEALSQANGVLDIIKNYIPVLKYSINAILSENTLGMVIEFAKMIGMLSVSFIIYIMLSQKLYFKGLIGCLYSGDKKKNKKIKIKSKGKNIGKLYIGKEFKSLFREPIYLMQCIIPIIVFPIICVAIVVIVLDKSLIEQLLSYVSSTNQEGAILLGTVAIIQFFYMTTCVSIIAISKDGRNAAFMKYIPIPLYKQYLYKTAPNIIMNLFPAIIITIASKYFFNISIVDMLVVLGTATIINVTISFLLTLVDLKRPKLKWNSEYAIVKQNINLLFPVLFSLIGIILLIIYIETTKAISVYIILGMISGVYLLIGIITNVYMYKRQEKLANKID